MTSTIRFSKARPLLVDFQLIPTPSLDFQVALNHGDTAPLTLSYKDPLKQKFHFIFTLLCKYASLKW